MRRSKKVQKVLQNGNRRLFVKRDSINRYCYTNPIMLSEENNRIYLFGRNIVRNRKKDIYRHENILHL